MTYTRDRSAMPIICRDCHQVINGSIVHTPTGQQCYACYAAPYLEARTVPPPIGPAPTDWLLVACGLTLLGGLLLVGVTAWVVLR